MHAPLPAAFSSTAIAPTVRALALAGALGAATLCGPAWAGAAPVLNLAGLKASHSYTPSVGESLERIVAKTMPNSPLRSDVLAQAFVALNPQAFGKSVPLRTLGSAALQVPNHNQLMHIALASASEPRQVSAPKATPAPAPVERREQWVRYLGGAVVRARSDSTARTDTQSWVHYPALSRSANAGAVLPETRIDTSKWVRYVALRIYPQQQPTVLFD